MTQMPSALPDLARTVEHATGLLPDYQRCVEGRSYEPKGILFSEMLFLAGVARQLRVERIVESGRARGQSTLVLARTFPEIPVVSVERDAEGEDARIAAARLSDVPNVELWHGDSMRLLPEVVHRGDLVLIDGPKGWRSLRLALLLLRRNRPEAVLVHDCHAGTGRRCFLERHVPHAFYSDDARFVETCARLDAPCAGAGAWRPYHFAGGPQRSYGPTLACLTPREGFDHGAASRRLLVTAWRDKARRSLAKRGRRRS